MYVSQRVLNANRWAKRLDMRGLCPRILPTLSIDRRHARVLVSWRCLRNLWTWSLRKFLIMPSWTWQKKLDVKIFVMMKNIKEILRIALRNILWEKNNKYLPSRVHFLYFEIMFFIPKYFFFYQKWSKMIFDCIIEIYYW